MDIVEQSDGQLPSENDGIKLAPELAAHINEVRLRDNAERYPELQIHLSSEQQRKVGLIKEKLYELPLIHATREPIHAGLNIAPTMDLPDDHLGHTYGLDRSLGLDQYVFFHWGLPEKSSYGRNFLLVSPSLLTKPNTIVTPSDIGSIAFVDQTPFDQLPSDRKNGYQDKYFDKMVTGDQWLEIVARKVLASYEAGNPFFDLYSSSTLGEIKHLGQVDSSLVTSQISDKQLHEYYKFLYEHGFSVHNMEQNRMLYQRTGKKHGVDPLPEECGVDYEQSSHYWEKLLS